MRWVVFALALFALSVSRAEAQFCSPENYTVFTINGMFTEEDQAVANRDSLRKELPVSLNGENIYVDYLFNPSHIGGIGDIIDSINQKIFDTETVKDFDMTEIWKQAHQKIHTQKVLLVGHSQGNFYSNSFYDLLAGKKGGIPKQSLGIYGVATPSSRVAGGGDYVTSSNDTVMNMVRSLGKISVLPANLTIPRYDEDPNGHSFTLTYMKYAKEKIAEGVSLSLKKLKNNFYQDENSSCIEAPEPDLGYKILEKVYQKADPIALGGKKVIEKAVKLADYASNALATGVLALFGEEEENKEVAQAPAPVPTPAPTPTPASSHISPSPETKKEVPKEEVVIEKEIEEKVEKKEKRKIKSGIVYHHEEEPVIEEPVIEEPVIEEPVVPEEPVIEEPVIPEDPIEEEPIAEEPVIVEEAPIEPKTYPFTYNPKYSFGVDELGRDWQVWVFNGSYVYDWQNSRENGYLRQQFKLQSIRGDSWCSSCLEMGLFKHDPRIGFETSDFFLRPLAMSPQNKTDGNLYDIILQWDSGGYAFDISHYGNPDWSGHEDIPESDSLWVGWDNTHNGFRNFPSGDWYDPVPLFVPGMTGGGNMMLEPQAVYVAPEM